MNVLIVEDDPMVEFIHRNYLEKGGQFSDIYSASNLQQANELIQDKKIDLILLDIHLKDGNGLDLLSELRTGPHPIEVILITAANEAQTVKDGLHLGVVDYLIKPFSNERFQQAIQLFFIRQHALATGALQQDTIDQLMLAPTEEHMDMTIDNQTLDKGLTPETLERIQKVIPSLKIPFTIQELANAAKLSHVSVRKYIAYLEEHRQLESQIIYTKVGRPYKVYHPC